MVAEFRKTQRHDAGRADGLREPDRAHGPRALRADARKAAGVDGVLIVDYPPEESADWLRGARRLAASIRFSSVAHLERRAHRRWWRAWRKGYIYYVSLKGVTGAANIDTADVEAMIARIRSARKLPMGVGFGIRDGATARRVARVADAVVIGSRIVQEIADAPRTRGREAARRSARRIPRRAMDAARGATHELVPQAPAAQDQARGHAAEEGRPRGPVEQVRRRARRCCTAPTSRTTSTSARSAASTTASLRASASTSSSIPRAALRSAPKSCRWIRSSSRTAASTPSAWRRPRRKPARPTRWS